MVMICRALKLPALLPNRRRCPRLPVYRYMSTTYPLVASARQ